MKNKMNVKLQYFLSLDYPMIVNYDKEDEVYVVQFPDLPGCIAHGTTPARAIKLAEIIKREWIEDSLEAGQIIPVPKNDDEYSGKFVVRIPSYLHKRLSEQAERERRSLNQHIGVLLAERSAALLIENSIERFSNIESQLQGHVAAINRVVTKTTQMVRRSSVESYGSGNYIMPSSAKDSTLKTYTQN